MVYLFQVGVPFSTENAKWTAFWKVYSENKNTEYTKENTKYANQNPKYAKQNTKYAKQNTKYANQNTKYAKQNTKYAKQNTKYAISIKRVCKKNKKWYNLQYVNLYFKILIYAKSEAIFVANLRTFLAYLLQA